MNAKQATEYVRLKILLQQAMAEHNKAVQAHVTACDNYVLSGEEHTDEWYFTAEATDKACLEAEEKVRVAYRAMVDYYNEATDAD